MLLVIAKCCGNYLQALEVVQVFEADWFTTDGVLFIVRTEGILLLLLSIENARLFYWPADNDNEHSLSFPTFIEQSVYNYAIISIIAASMIS